MTVALHVEARVLAEILTNPTALAMAENLELDDFALLAHQWAFAALRNLQAAGESIGVIEVVDAIAMDDLTLETNKSHTVDVRWMLHLLDITRRTARWYRELLDVVFPADLRQLRTFARRRRTALKAA